MARSQNGWTANQRHLMSWFAVPGTNVKLLLRKEYAGPLLALVAELFDRTVEPISDPGCWSYAERPIRGGRALSNHASGTAIDLNAPRHPLGARGTFTPHQTRAIREIISLTDGAIRWGGDYRSRKDEMHFEINTTDVAKIILATSRLRAKLHEISR